VQRTQIPKLSLGLVFNSQKRHHNFVNWYIAVIPNQEMATLFLDFKTLTSFSF